MLAKKRKNVNLDLISKNKKIPLKLDITMMNMIIGIIFKNDNLLVTRKNLVNIKKLVDIIDEKVFEQNEALEVRFIFIKRALEAKLIKVFENHDTIINYCIADITSNEINEIVKNLPYYANVKIEEIKYINKTISDRLQYSYLFIYKDVLYDCIERLDSGDYDSFEDINELMKDIVSRLLNNMRKANVVNTVNNFSLDDENYDAILEDIVNEIKNPFKILSTGIQKLNQILAPGFYSKKLYIFMGLPASFKSGILISIAYWFKLYTKNIKTKKNKIPTALYVTLENSVHETIERIFNMAVVADDIKNFTTGEIIRRLKEDGKFSFKGKGDINIVIQYYNNREIDTGDLYNIIEDLEDDNKEVICLILDYIKRIRPREKGRDEKEELKNITNELKTLANDFDIPVISAHQLNRAGATVVDNAAIQNKEDLGRFLGRANVGSAWEIIENSDWNCILNLEKKKATGQYYLTFKRVKLRYRDPNDVIYFNHPFMMGNRMRLIPDVDLDQSLSEISLATDMEAVKIGKRRTAIERDYDEGDDLFDNSSEVK